ncbi:MAG: ribosomal-protein-alanine N-acetyltransferase [Chloroflexi bacterium RBG_16_58_8]|nr:MAG: ribosomal-protein-alanine N-acetyltransferase [Chloroflexi bacterium RBG_16_58_8]
MTYCIRRMEKSDLSQVNEIDHEAFPTQWPPPNYRQELQNQLAHYIVLYDNTRTLESPVAKHRPGIFGRLSRFWRPGDGHTPESAAPRHTTQYIIGFSGIWMMADEAHITNIAVRQEFRGRGLGEMLLIATIDIARELKASLMTLEVRASNVAAQKLYGKYGFAQAGLRRGYYLDNHEDAIIMSTESIDSPAFQAHLQELRQAVARKFS